MDPPASPADERTPLISRPALASHSAAGPTRAVAASWEVRPSIPGLGVRRDAESYVQRLAAREREREREAAAASEHETRRPGLDSGFGSSRREVVCELLVVLYALSMVRAGRASASASESGVAGQPRTRLERNALVEELEDRSWRLADALEAASVEGPRDALDNQEGDGTCGALWEAYESGEKAGHCVCAIDLLLPPYAPHPPSLLLHPHISSTLYQTWHCGLAPTYTSTRPDRTPLTRRKHIYASLRRHVTPARIHLLHVLSLITLYVLVIVIAVRPGNYATPYSPFGPDGRRRRGKWVPSPAEGMATLWIVGDFWAAFHRPLPPTRLLLLPLYLAVPISLYSNSGAYTLLTLSLPTLTTLLLLPSYPSPALLAPRALLPLSTLLAHALARVLWPGVLLAPLALGLAGAASWAINGDLGRMAVGRLADAAYESWMRGGGGWKDTEGGTIAPLQARWTLVLCLGMVLAYAALLGFARLMLLLRPRSTVTRPVHRPPQGAEGGRDGPGMGADGVPTARGGGNTVPRAGASDMPLSVQLAAAAHLASAVRAGIGRPSAHSHASGSAPRDATLASHTSAENGDGLGASYDSISASVRDESTSLPISPTHLTHDIEADAAASGADGGQHHPHPHHPRARLMDPFVVCPVPLNQLFDVLELAHLAARAARHVPILAVRRRAEQGEWEAQVERAADWAAVLLLGPMCWGLYLIEGGWRRGRWRRRG